MFIERNRDVEEQRREIFVRDDGSVHRETNVFSRELRMSFQDAAAGGQFHVSAKLVMRFSPRFNF